jgi:hypothetical protein
VALIKAGPSEIELLEPTNEDSTVRKFLDRRGPGLHHVCFVGEDVEASMRHFEKNGATFIDPVPRPGAVGLVSFMPPSQADGVLVEFAQTSGYTLPEVPVEVEETAAEPVITTPILRGPGGYTRAGIVGPLVAPGWPAAVATPATAEVPAEADTGVADDEDAEHSILGAVPVDDAPPTHVPDDAGNDEPGNPAAGGAADADTAATGTATNTASDDESPTVMLERPALDAVPPVSPDPKA